MSTKTSRTNGGTDPPGDTARINTLRHAAEEMRRGHFDVAIPIEGPGHVAELGKAMQALAESLRLRFDELDRLARIAERVNAGVMLDEVLDEVYESFRSVIPYERIGLALLEDRGRVARARWARSEGLEIKLSPGYAGRLEGSSLEEILESGRPRILNDLEAYLEKNPNSESTRLIVQEGIRSSLTCPLVALGKPIGFLFFSSREKNTYDRLHQSYFMQLASQISVVLEKSRLYEELLSLNKRLQDARTALEHEASHDALTGLWNRRAILRLLEQEMARSAREERPLAAVILDLDHFKPVNDEHGHLVGDEVLVELAQRLTRTLRSGEPFGRIGGEEFLVILGPGDGKTAERVMERVRLACADEPFDTTAGPLAITASLGAAVVEAGDGVELSTVLSAADEALYEAKSSGRNRWAVRIIERS